MPEVRKNFPACSNPREFWRDPRDQPGLWARDDPLIFVIFWDVLVGDGVERCGSMGDSGMPRIDQPERPRPPPPLQARKPRRTYKRPHTPTGPSTHIIVYPWKPMKVGQSTIHVRESPGSDSNPQRHNRSFLDEPSNWLPLHQVKIRRDPQTPLLVGFVASTESNFAVAVCTCRTLVVMKNLPAITNFRRSFQSTSSDQCGCFPQLPSKDNNGTYQ
ncbi:hypothetical protein BJ322DRAFT_1016832 [Thelephora terrestris]|uniref:Uncharacterized protein n=1 Tax=Thelephora terrestris TaxID=56493 RepID=A0A9P6LCD3_9AGAM|nr:hypothetical protein BJ322DRAFT_1016832 [Thelephora terrestris]